MNEPEEEEERRCAKHKMPLEIICITCNSLKCCYKCFSMSNLHYQHSALFSLESDLPHSYLESIEEQSSHLANNNVFQQQQQEKQLKKKPLLIQRREDDSSKGRDDMRKERERQQQNDKQLSLMKNYRIQIDNLCKQITEQVWNYRQKFIQYMDSKLNEYNVFILVEQGSQITSEMISMRNELENFIFSLKNQIKSIDSFNGQKMSIQNIQQQQCYCESAGAYQTYLSSHYQAHLHTNNNSNNNNNNDDDNSTISQPSPSCCSCSCSSSSSYSSSPSSYSCSSSNCAGFNYQQQQQQQQQQHQLNYRQINSPFYSVPNNMKNKNEIMNELQNNLGDNMIQQHLFTCSNYQVGHKQGHQDNTTQSSFNQINSLTRLQQLSSSSSPSQSSSIPSTSSSSSSSSFSPRPRQISQIFVILTNGKSLPLVFNIYCSVLQIKILIFEKTGVPPLEQKLFFYTKELHNYTAMKDYSIPRDCSLKLYIRSFYSQLQSISKKQIASMPPNQSLLSAAQAYYQSPSFQQPQSQRYPTSSSSSPQQYQTFSSKNSTPSSYSCSASDVIPQVQNEYKMNYNSMSIDNTLIEQNRQGMISLDYEVEFDQNQSQKQMNNDKFAIMQEDTQYCYQSNNNFNNHPV